MKTNLDEAYNAYKEGTLEEYCKERNLDHVLFGMVLRELPNAMAYSVMGVSPLKNEGIVKLMSERKINANT